MDCQAPLSMGFSRQECWSGLPRCPPGHHPSPGIRPEPLASAVRFFTASTTWEAPREGKCLQMVPEPVKGLQSCEVLCDCSPRPVTPLCPWKGPGGARSSLEGAGAVPKLGQASLFLWSCFSSLVSGDLAPARATPGSRPPACSEPDSRGGA